MRSYQTAHKYRVECRNFTSHFPIFMELEMEILLSQHKISRKILEYSPQTERYTTVFRKALSRKVLHPASNRSPTIELLLLSGRISYCLRQARQWITPIIFPQGWVGYASVMNLGHNRHRSRVVEGSFNLGLDPCVEVSLPGLHSCVSASSVSNMGFGVSTI